MDKITISCFLQWRRNKILTSFFVYHYSNVLQILGLDVCADTMVGDPVRRGISGGQKKRLTTGTIVITTPWEFCEVSFCFSDMNQKMIVFSSNAI